MQDPEIIDARGLKCPMPVLKLEKQLHGASAGRRFLLISDDPVARIDVPVLCQKNNYACVIEQDGKALRFIITKR